MTKLPRIVQRPSGNYSSRAGARVRVFVYHSTIGGYIGSVAWLRNRASQASAHQVEREDGGELSQLVPWSLKAWHVAAYNSVADGLEMAGPPHSVPQLRVAARLGALRLRARGLPPRWARFGIGLGYTRHRDLGAAGGGHHDPVLSLAAWNLLSRLTKAEYLALRKGVT